MNKRWIRNGIVLLIASLAIISVFRMATFDTDFNPEIAYQLPEFASLDNLSQVSYGQWAVAIDGQLIASHTNTTESVQPTASTTKMILALAVMREKPFNLGETGETITINQEFYDIYNWYITHNGSNSAVQIGEEISEYDALASVLLVSSNNMADTLAIWAFGSLDNYRNSATQMLQEWGITNTTIGTDASGYDSSTTSSASDLAKIGHKLLENPVLAQIVGLSSHVVPIAGTLTNSNALLGQNGVIGVKTGFIGEESGYCLVTGYKAGEHIITISLLGAPDRLSSFSDSNDLILATQAVAPLKQLTTSGQVVGYYHPWWSEPVPITATQDFTELGWNTPDASVGLNMPANSTTVASDATNATGTLDLKFSNHTYHAPVATPDFAVHPSLLQRFLHLFGWRATPVNDSQSAQSNTETASVEAPTNELIDPSSLQSITTATTSHNDTIKFGYLMLINPNFTVDDQFIAKRRTELVSLTDTYNIKEQHAYNGDNLLDAEAAKHLNDLVQAYQSENPDHTLGTLSCFRSVGTSCGRLCYATGTSDHHTGLTCDLVDPSYGLELDTDLLPQHPEWQWLKQNSYKYGFIDRFPESWAGGPMTEPVNVDENGSTGLFETWHYRYVGLDHATNIATGKFNNGAYDSLEHYLKANNLIPDLKNQN